MTEIRPPAVAGLFYPASARTLADDVDRLLERAGSQRKPGTELHALIVPHAGYVYSGLTAAYAYSLLSGRSFETVVVVGPSHREYFDGVSLYSGDAFETPLGVIPVDQNLRTALADETNGIAVSLRGHRKEHSVEVQYPFLQRTLRAFATVPVVMGDQRRALCTSLAEALTRALRGKRVLLVASSDLSHYHPYDEAVALDARVRSAVEAFDTDTLASGLEEERFEACGGGPMVAVMMAAHELGSHEAEILHFCNSGDVTGEKDAVVGYLSAAMSSSVKGGRS